MTDAYIRVRKPLGWRTPQWLRHAWLPIRNWWMRKPLLYRLSRLLCDPPYRGD